MTAFVERDGGFWCEEVPLRVIAEAVGTPVYVYSTAAMLANAAAMQAAVSGTDDPLVAYAVKANPNAAVLKVLAGAGLGADVVSIGEYRRARAAGVAPDRIVFAGVGKTRAEMEGAIAGGVLQFNVESVEEARLLSAVAEAVGRKAPMAFRVNPDVAADTHAKITTGRSSNKFGIPIAEALEAYRIARALPGLEVTGAAVHIGSQLTNLDPLRMAFERLGDLIVTLRSDGIAIRTADLGGGLGVIYDLDLPEPPSPDEYGAMVRRVTAGWDARLIFEPGRVIVGDAGVLLTQVIRVKPGVGDPWVIVDAAMNDLMRPALYDAFHAVEAVQSRAATRRANVVGPVCETGDTFALARPMPAVEEGDFVFLRTAGAYGATMSSGYNSRPLTPEVLVDGARWAIVRRRVDLDELAGVAEPVWTAT